MTTSVQTTPIRSKLLHPAYGLAPEAVERLRQDLANDRETLHAD